MEKIVKKPVTLRQVAETAGVSAATASLVINGKGDISDATRERVLAAVESLNYTPRSVRAKHETGHVVRFLKISKHGDTVNRDHNHFISDYIDGMSREALRRDFALEVVSHEGPEISELLSGLDGRDLSGIIALGTELSENDIATLSDCGMPIVFIDTFHPFLEASFVDMDNDQAMFSVATHLQHEGYRRIGFVGSHSDVANFRLRDEAFSRACARLGISIAPVDRVDVPATREGAYRGTRAHFDASPSIADAYVCANDVIAFGVMRALEERGLHIPNDVAVVGFDNLPMSSLFSPTLSSVDVPKQKIGAMAVRLLDDMIISPAKPPAVKVLVAGKLIERASTVVSKKTKDT
ncbi:LacI family DNA-binding transcriptional regulator [Celeribacter halophilus]|jgi:LacI family transcriptional regulator|uniref:LacI family DNA-binding transcriptional regulator n=1 Tax=Celeribacter halophilus TaxID=576117 RepID=UPI002FD13FE3